MDEDLCLFIGLVFKGFVLRRSLRFGLGRAVIGFLENGFIEFVVSVSVLLVSGKRFFGLEWFVEVINGCFLKF